jgi:hypothetical protein
VLGLHNYWFGLEDFDYRSFLVPLSWTDPRNEPRRLPLDEALESVAPDVVLMDPRMRAYFSTVAASNDEVPTRFAKWLQRHRGRMIGSVDNPTYGLIEVYQVAR